MRFLRLQYQLFRIRRRNAIQVYPIEPEFSDTIEIPRFRLPPAVAQLRIEIAKWESAFQVRD